MRGKHFDGVFEQRETSRAILGCQTIQSGERIRFEDHDRASRSDPCGELADPRPVRVGRARTSRRIPGAVTQRDVVCHEHRQGAGGRDRRNARVNGSAKVRIPVAEPVSRGLRRDLVHLRRVFRP